MLIHLPREHGYRLIPRTKNGPALAATAPSRWQALWRKRSPRSPRNYAGRRPGIEVRNCRRTPSSRSLPVSRCTSPTRRAVAARHQREHQRPVTPILSKGHRPIPLERRRNRSHRPYPQHPTTQYPRLTRTPAEAFNDHLHSLQQAGVAVNWRFCLPARSPAVRGRRRCCSAVGAEALPSIACALSSIDVCSAEMGGPLE